MVCNLAAQLRQKPVVNVDINAIDLNDQTFVISTADNQEALAHALQFAGLLHPVWLKPQGAGYQIISGFARVRAALREGWEVIPAWLLAENTSELELAQLAIMDNFSARILNAVEEARATALLRRFTADEAQWHRYLSRLGLSNAPKHLAKLEHLLQLPSITQKAVADGLVALAVVNDLARFDLDVILQFTEIFVKGKVGLNRQREFIRLVYELSRLRDLAAGEIFKLPAMAALWQDDDSDLRKKALLVLEWLYQERYPHLSAAREQARRKISALELDQRLRLNMPENFENLRHSLSFSFVSQAELLELLELCRLMVCDENFAQLFQREEV